MNSTNCKNLAHFIDNVAADNITTNGLRAG